MSGLPNTVTNESIFRIPVVPAKISCQDVPEENTAEAVTRDMASSDWLKLVALVCFPGKVYIKINPFVTVLGQDRKVIDQHSYLIRSWFLLQEKPY